MQLGSVSLCMQLGSVSLCMQLGSSRDFDTVLCLVCMAAWNDKRV